ncbi:hypothetical protein THASP1DRAFT_23508 [Thamnocephalis sphaerospora]|uniref:Fork-head domain-containing protein n=1 Tax=Thamnocephalis sphaerospora TaxID=78915 RepID=A0A4P9XRE8_9FUNG|nr:hypothetical protein THASP1DRAFT_23508 [Thamnocephalis sphaerospora]|eukprot:RKP08512.1 hypothetical protein THASP1DRAFT_23508 [Thamnocephalis sphaerospora]
MALQFDHSRLLCLADAAAATLTMAAASTAPAAGCTLPRITLPRPNPTARAPSPLDAAATAVWDARPGRSTISPLASAKARSDMTLPPLSTLMPTFTPSATPSPVTLAPLADLPMPDAAPLPPSRASPVSDDVLLAARALSSPVSAKSYLPSPHPSPNMGTVDDDITMNDAADAAVRETATNETAADAEAKPSRRAGRRSNGAAVTRRRRRPPFSYASLIAQAILSSPERRLTLREIYQWLMERYPTLYRADDSSWQCFCKAARLDVDPAAQSSKGKGGYWTVDAAYMPLFRNGQWQRAADLGPETSQQVAGLLRVRGGVPRRHAPPPPAALMAAEADAVATGASLTPSRADPYASASDSDSTSVRSCSPATPSPLLSPLRTPSTPTLAPSDLCRPTSPSCLSKTVPPVRGNGVSLADHTTPLLRIGSLLN